MLEIEKMLLFKDKGFTYNPETGEVFGIKGVVCNSIAKNGYIYLTAKLNGERYRVLAHRLAWFLYYGEVPNIIDHINRNKLDNRITNIRNVNLHKNNLNIFGKGYEKRGNKYQAAICVNKSKKYLGLYNTEIEAHQAYLDAKKIYHVI